MLLDDSVRLRLLLPAKADVVFLVFEPLHVGAGQVFPLFVARVEEILGFFARQLQLRKRGLNLVGRRLGHISADLGNRSLLASLRGLSPSNSLLLDESLSASRLVGGRPGLSLPFASLLGQCLGACLQGAH